MTALLHAQLEASQADLAFTVPVAPRAWSRARKNGNRFFKSPAAVAFEVAISSFGADAMRGRELMAGPLAMTVISILPVPESWSRKKQAQALTGAIRPTGKPDADNLAKAAADAINQVVYRDDAQVVDLRSIKFYGAEPAMQIAVRALDQHSEPGRVASP